MGKLKLLAREMGITEVLSREELKTICGVPKAFLPGSCSASIVCKDGTSKECSCTNGVCGSVASAVSCACQTETETNVVVLSCSGLD
ncbi:hypothetical protein DVR12_26835 [Chitinophaga silvatica]|uniref:Uncharacterized protein n=1 Tax=Chitinophaga silvatica TaxID=2282649 RepID=A0A3E1Y2T1_9BACT|nr:hypothetical protein [Chitinophaga silvatica]RFS18817.1 hypothetical protein DVR12_26835 [Chitinophaga silvatica]